MGVREYLDSFINYEKKIKFDYKKSLKLERMKKLLKDLGFPYQELNVIHIAGTKGKGSISNLLSSILSTKYKVGLFTSPHLVDLKERIRVLTNKDKEGFIKESELEELTRHLKPVLEKNRFSKKLGYLSFFEVYTALALFYFFKKKTDFVILEAGLGGRLDATNCCYGKYIGYGLIDYDHQDKLGRTLKEITYEKAGFIKKAQSVVSFPQRKSVSSFLRKICKERKCEFLEVNKEIKVRELSYNKDFQEFSYLGKALKLENLKIPLLGFHQILNSGVAIGITEILIKEGLKIKEEDIKRGLENVKIAGRFEIIKNEPLIILDCAHNPASILVLRDTLLRHFPDRRVILVFGTSKDKDFKKMGKILFNMCKKIILTKAEVQKAQDPYLIKKSFKKAQVIPDPCKAILKAIDLCDKKDLILVTGSVYLVGKIRENLC